MSKNSFKKISLVTASILLALVNITSSYSVSALSGSSFQSGRIIDDSIFNDKNTMTAADIQNFLNSKVPVCDTNGTQMYNSTQTRAQYSAQYGVSPPFTCLENYFENPSTHANNLDGNPIPAGAISAAQIIYNASQQYDINPEVLIVLLQKEQGLVLDSWPWDSEYTEATGYGCPDSASTCASQYSGFYNQVTNAAWQFQQYESNPGEFNYVPGSGSCSSNVQNCIAYNPNASCGSSAINILSQATANLYDYTPYQPDAAAINNLGGTGDSCSSYGNLNFWMYFNEWFGPSLTGYSTSDLNWNSENLIGPAANVDPTSGQFGSYSSTTSLNGVLHTFYYDSATQSLGHAWADTSGWHFETLDGNGSSYSGSVDDDVGQYVSAGVYNGNIVVAYYDNTIHSLRLAEDSSGTWSFYTLDGSQSSISGETDDVGKGISLVQYGSTLQLFYYDSTTGNLRHAWSDSNGWHFENLDGDWGSIGKLNDNLGQSPYANVYGSSLQVFYYDASSGGLRHAWSDSNGWHFENLDGANGSSISGSSLNVGLYPQFVTYNGTLQLFYYDISQGDLRHAWDDNRGWHFENLDGDIGSISKTYGMVGKSPTVFVLNNVLRVYYYDEINQSIKEAYDSPNGWHFGELDGINTSVTQFSVNLGENTSGTLFGGGIQLFEQNKNTGALRHLWNTYD